MLAMTRYVYSLSESSIADLPPVSHLRLVHQAQESRGSDVDSPPASGRPVLRAPGGGRMPVAVAGLVLVLTAMALQLIPAEAGAAPPSTNKTVLQYIVSPHPDDVFMGWSLVQDSAANYPVFITFTQGESTSKCVGPAPYNITIGLWGTFDRSTPAGCKGARMASLNDWLDDQSAADPYLDDVARPGASTMTTTTELAPAGGTDPTGAPLPATMTACRPVFGSGGCSGTNPNVGTPIPDNLNPGGGTTAARTVTWRVGGTSARVEFDLGDGNLTNAEIVWAMAYVRSRRAALLPLTAEYGVVGAAYSNLNQRYKACTDYSHHDHRAVHEALHHNDLIPDPGNHPQWAATCGNQAGGSVDPEALPVNGGRQNQITAAHYSENMAGTGPRYFQVRFDWLNGPVWPSGNEPTNGVIFAGWNYFWRRF